MESIVTKVILFILFFSSGSCKTSSFLEDNLPHFWAQKINCSDFENLYRVDRFLFRSEQPSKIGLEALRKMGVRTVLNVRNLSNDRWEGRGNSLKLIHYRINTWTISYTEIVEV
jgi:hypothetical protein